MSKIADGNVLLDATFSVAEHQPGTFAVIVESRSGAKDGPAARNVNYEHGVEVVIERLQRIDAVITAAQLVPKIPPARQPAVADLVIPGHPFPWTVRREGSAQDLRRLLGAAQAATSRQAGAKGLGNHTKRFQMICHIPEFDGDAADLEDYLSRGDTVAAHEAAFARAAIADLAKGRGGQRFVASAKVRKAVEQRAMAVAVAHFSAEGWAVDSSVAKTCCYDLCCTRDGSPEQHVEVKGTVGSGTEVFLTCNEVLHAKEQYPNVALALVTQIALTNEGEPVATGGVLRVIAPWQLDEAALEPMAYAYTVPVEVERPGAEGKRTGSGSAD